MNHQETLLFFRYQRQIFGICPCCGEFFRLSDCKIAQDEKEPSDWLEKLKNEDRQLTNREAKLEQQLETLRVEARNEGRKTAGRLVKKVDKVFTPQKLNPDDAKVIFHPVDYLVFNGMKNQQVEGLKNIIFLDAAQKLKEAKTIQRSLEKAIEQEKYEWLTLRVRNDGQIEEE